jgi:hypothetical protein
VSTRQWKRVGYQHPGYRRELRVVLNFGGKDSVTVSVNSTKVVRRGSDFISFLIVLVRNGYLLGPTKTTRVPAQSQKDKEPKNDFRAGRGPSSTLGQSQFVQLQWIIFPQLDSLGSGLDE